MLRDAPKVAVLAGIALAMSSPSTSVAAISSFPDVAATAWSDGFGRAGMTDEGKVSLDQAIRKVRGRYGDVTILKAKTRKRNGGGVHSIKFLTDSGRVRTVRVDAQTGDFL
jgi:uncharacterized membrane protein YkoI